jgi:hypothetical protein
MGGLQVEIGAGFTVTEGKRITLAAAPKDEVPSLSPSLPLNPAAAPKDEVPPAHWLRPAVPPSAVMGGGRRVCPLEG